MRETSGEEPRGSPGQPTKLTAATADAICQRLRAGVPRVHAAESAGVSRRTLMLWLEHGRAAALCERPDCDEAHHGPARAELEYLHFLHMVEQAEADAVVLAVGDWRKAMPRDWRAAQAWLERRHPAEFRPEPRALPPGPEGAPVPQPAATAADGGAPESARAERAAADERLALTVPEAAKVPGIGTTLLYELVDRDEIPAVRLGRAVRISRRALEEWIAAGGRGAPKPPAGTRR